MQKSILVFLVCYALTVNLSFCQTPNEQESNRTNSHIIYLKHGQSLIDVFYSKTSIFKFPHKISTTEFSVNRTPYTLFINQGIEFNNKKFKESDKFPVPPEQAKNYEMIQLRHFYLTQCNLDLDLNLSKLNAGLLDFRDDTIKRLTFYNFKANVLFDNILLKNLNFEITKSQIELNISNLKTANDSLLFWCEYSNVKLTTYQSFPKNSSLVFLNDTISGVTFHPTTEGENILIENCSTLNQTNSEEANLSFENVHFLKMTKCSLNGKIEIENVDTVMMTNCGNPKMSFNFLKSKPKIFYVCLTNTDVTDIHFSLPDNFKLIFEDNTSPEEYEQTYLQLRDKFKKDNKSISYQNVDIQYSQYTFSRYGFLGKFWSWIDNIWWNYGYARLRIIGWTVGLILFFFIFNFLLFESLLTFYPIYKNNIRYLRTNYKLFDRMIMAFALTVHIFFTLKIDLNLLKFERTRMLIYFFFQYTIGLICLFFLFNAIFKI